MELSNPLDYYTATTPLNFTITTQPYHWLRMLRPATLGGECRECSGAFTPMMVCEFLLVCINEEGAFNLSMRHHEEPSSGLVVNCVVLVHSYFLADNTFLIWISNWFSAASLIECFLFVSSEIFLVFSSCEKAVCFSSCRTVFTRLSTSGSRAVASLLYLSLCRVDFGWMSRVTKYDSRIAISEPDFLLQTSLMTSKRRAKWQTAGKSLKLQSPTAPWFHLVLNKGI